MKIKLTPPALIVESKLKGWQEAVTTLFVIRHNPYARRSVIEHELMHVRQFWFVGGIVAIALWFLFWPLWFMGFAAHYVLNGISKTYRKHAEAMAFAASVEYGATLNGAAKALSEKYRLGIGEIEAAQLIKRYRELLFT